MMSGYHKLKTACCAAVLTLGLAACGGGGNSDADLNAAAAKAKQEAETAAAEAARVAAAAAEMEKQQAVAEAERLAAEQAAEQAAAAAEMEKQQAVAEAERLAAEQAAEQAAAAEEMARATVQMNAISDAVTAAQTALGMVVLGATDMDISDAEMAVEAARVAIAAAEDVDDTSMYTATVNGIESSLMTAAALVGQDRATKMMARAEMQSGDIMDAITAAEDALALVVEGASNMDIEAAGMAVQAARDAIAAAEDVEDTSMYTATVDGLESSVMTASETVLADRLNDRIELQKGDIMIAIAAAETAVEMVVLGATDMDIEAAATAVEAAKVAIAAADDVEDTSMYTATVNGLESGLMAASDFVMQDRTAKKVLRAATQLANIMTAITDAQTALGMVDLQATDMEIADAKSAVQAVRDAIAAAVDVDDTSTHTTQINGIAGRLGTAEVAALAYRTLKIARLAGEQQEAIDGAIVAAVSAVGMVGPDADADDVADAETKVQDVKDAIAAALNVDDTSMDTTTVDGLENTLGQRKAIFVALMDATDALDALDNYSSDDDIQNVQDKIDAVTTAIGDADALDAADKDAFAAKVDDADGGLLAMLVADTATIEMARADKVAREAAEHVALAKAIMRMGLPIHASALLPDSEGEPMKTHKLSIASPPEAVGGDWSGLAYGRTNEKPASDDRVVIYDSKGADENPRYDIYYGVAANATAVTGTFTDATGIMMFSNLGMAGDRLSPDGLTATTFDGTPADTTDNDGAPSTFAGSFHGVPGSFACDGGCTIQELASGGYVTSGGWEFTPADYAGLVTDRPTVTISDPDFMHFGYWTNTKDDSKGNPVVLARAFFNGTAPSDLSASAVRGIDGFNAEGAVDDTKALVARYEGPASGLYVLKTFDPRGTVTPTESGQFTADAELTAVFGTSGGVAERHQDSVRGTITGFTNAAGEEIDSKWRTALAATKFDSGGPVFSSVVTASGEWQYSLFGGAADDDTATTGVDERTPTGIAGQFNSHFTNGHVLGGFGVTYQDSTSE